MSFQIYGGNGRDLGHVSRLPLSSFADFVRDRLGEPIILNVTRAQFEAMDKTSRAAAKRVPFVTPACFNLETAHRVTQNATTFHLVALDIDDSSQARTILGNLPSTEQALEPWPFAIYTTASSTPEAPRIRVMVEATGLPCSDYVAAVTLLGQRLGLPAVNRESLVPVQPMYLPTIFAGDDALSQHPLVVARIEGTPLTASDLEGVTPTRADTPRAPVDYSDGSDLEFLRAPVEDVTLAELEEALSHLDPDMAYPDWLDIAAALRHQYPREPESEQAYQLFDRWSSKGSKYAGQADTFAKWRSLQPSPRGRLPITARTLMTRAAAEGWNGIRVSQRAYARLVGWIGETGRTGNELMNQGIRRLAAIPLLSPLEQGSLLTLLQGALRSAGVKVTRSDLARELQAHLRSVRAPSKDTPERKLPQWTRGIVYVASTHEFYQRAADRRMKPNVLDALFNRNLMDGESKSGKPPMEAQNYLLNVVEIPRVDEYCYEPARPEEVIFSVGSRRFINTFIPSYPEPVREGAEEVGAAFLRHIENLIGEPDYRRTLVDWMAYHVQQPGAKIHWAILLQGVQGCGKTLLADALRSVLGPTNVKSVDADHLMNSSYNDWATGAQVVVMEEVRIVGHSRHEVMNRLKPLISNQVIALNEKYRSLRQADNKTNYLMFTNHADALAITGDERRYFVLRSTLQTRAQVLALGPTYFRDLYQLIAKKAPQLRAWLEDWPISESFSPQGHAPETRYLTELVQDTGDALSTAIRHVLEDGDHPLIQPDLLSSRALRDAVQDYYPDRFSDQHLARVLREMGFEVATRTRLAGLRHQLWLPRGGGELEGLDVAAIAEARAGTSELSS